MLGSHSTSTGAESVDVFPTLAELTGLPAPNGPQQTLSPRGIWYTQVSGIWQTVWLESVPRTYIDDLRLMTRAKQGEIIVHVDVVGEPKPSQLKVIVRDGDEVVQEVAAGRSPNATYFTTIGSGAAQAARCFSAFSEAITGQLALFRFNVSGIGRSPAAVTARIPQRQLKLWTPDSRRVLRRGAQYPRIGWRILHVRNFVRSGGHDPGHSPSAKLNHIVSRPLSR